MKIDRLLGILTILVNIDRTTIKELAEKFEVSKRTIFRDLETLDKSGIPIVTYPGIGGGVSVVKGYKYNNNVFSRNDIRNIFTALSGLMSINKSNDLINLMAKIMPEKTNNVFSESQYLIDLSSWFKDSITEEKINCISEAIEEAKCIEVEYISKTSRKVRIIHPYKLVFKQSFWYLYGFCETSNDFRLFKVNRIVYYKLLNKNFTFKTVDKIDFERNGNSSLCFNEQSNAIYKINLEYDKFDEFLLTDKIDAKFFQRINNKEKGLIVFKVSDLDWAADFIINLQCRVKVLYPRELKEKVILRIKNMKEIYKDDI